MKKILIIIITFQSLNSYSQIYVSDNTYVYNNSSLIYSKDQLELNGANSSLYLRNGGQLLQGGTIAGGNNKGIGNLSVYQEGTSNNYGYNYWCSPVGVPSATLGNKAFGIGQIKRSTGLTSFGGQSITGGLDGSATSSSLVISNRWIYKFITQSQLSGWVYVGSNNTINPGEGFTMKGVSGTDTTNIGELTVNNPGSNQRYDFRGIPNNGIIDIEVSNGISGVGTLNSTLTGNPFPSAINLNLFLLENSGYTVNYTTGAITSGGPVNVINGMAYYWEHIKPATTHNIQGYIGGYGTYVPNGITAFSPGTYNSATWRTYNLDGTTNNTGGTSGQAYKRMFCPIAQGFLIAGTSAGYAKMKDNYRVFVKEGASNNSQFEKNNSGNLSVNSTNWDEIPNVANVDYSGFSKLEVPQIKIISIIDNQISKEITLAFNPNTTDGYDKAMDAIDVNQLSNTVHFPIDGSPYGISTMSFDINKRIPIAFKTSTQATFKVYVGYLINFTEAENIYLYDSLTGIYTDIKDGYFEITLPIGQYDDRFKITFINEILSSDDTIKSSLIITNDHTTLSIFNPDLLNINQIKLYDISGKSVLAESDLATKNIYTVSTAYLSEGFYIVKVFTSDGQFTNKKIIVKK